MKLYQVRMYSLFNYGLVPMCYGDLEEAMEGIERHFQRQNAGFLLSHGVICERFLTPSRWNIHTIVINEIVEKKKEVGEKWRVRYYNEEDEICRTESCPEPLAKEALQKSIREPEVYAVLSYRKTWEDEPEIPDEWLTVRVVVHPEKEAALLLERPMQEPLQF